MWAADSFADTEEQFIRDTLRSAAQMSQIRPAGVFQISACSEKKSLALQRFGTIVSVWFLMTCLPVDWEHTL